MSAQHDPAATRYRESASLIRRVLEAVQVLWLRSTAARIGVDMEGETGRRILELAVAGQLAQAAGAQRYVDAAVPGRRLPLLGRLDLRGFAGVASDGRPLASLLYVPAVTVALRRAAGAPDDEAMLAGLMQMHRVVSTQLADTGRGATQVAMAANPRTRMYARVVQLPACARCVVLAGRQYAYSEGFLRHPNCDCVIRPVTAEEWQAMDGPGDLVRQMSLKERRKVFGVDGARALDLGADIGQVVNARRGMATPGAATTTEGTTVRGLYGRQVRRAGGATQRGPGRYSGAVAPRLTPEGIFARASDRAEQIRLLRENAYLT